jgi:hypothetical protein
MFDTFLVPDNWTNVYLDSSRGPYSFLNQGTHPGVVVCHFNSIVSLVCHHQGTNHHLNGNAFDSRCCNGSRMLRGFVGGLPGFVGVLPVFVGGFTNPRDLEYLCLEPLEFGSMIFVDVLYCKYFLLQVYKPLQYLPTSHYHCLLTPITHKVLHG